MSEAVYPAAGLNIRHDAHKADKNMSPATLQALMGHKNEEMTFG
jgi:hypothetical protein